MPSRTLSFQRQFEKWSFCFCFGCRYNQFCPCLQHAPKPLRSRPWAATENSQTQTAHSPVACPRLRFFSEFSVGWQAQENCNSGRPGREATLREENLQNQKKCDRIAAGKGPCERDGEPPRGRPGVAALGNGPGRRLGPLWSRWRLNLLICYYFGRFSQVWKQVGFRLNGLV